MRLRIAAPIALCLLVTAAPCLADSVTHSVRPGESLSTIAARFGVSLSTLEARNHLTDTSVLQLGQQIVVPVEVRHPAPAVHAVSAQVSAALHAARIGKRRLASARIAAVQALWAATHVGSIPPAFAGAQPFDVAQRMFAIDARITRTAMRYLGVPYMWGGTGFSGVDCSGFVQSVFAKNGIALPRMADEQYSIGRRIAMSLLMPGDLVFFETYTSGASHVGIYLGHGRFIHASTRGVVIDALAMDYYASRYIGARRLVLR